MMAGSPGPKTFQDLIDQKNEKKIAKIELLRAKNHT